MRPVKAQAQACNGEYSSNEDGKDALQDRQVEPRPLLWTLQAAVWLPALLLVPTVAFMAIVNIVYNCYAWEAGLGELTSTASFYG